MLVNNPNTDTLVRVDLETGAEQVVLDAYGAPRGIWEFAPQIAAPRIGVARAASGFAISWEDPEGAWKLQSSAKLGSESAWGDVAAPEAGQRNVELSFEGASGFYRLVR